MSPDLSMFVICPAASKLTFLDSSELKSAVVTSPEVLMFVMFPELSKWMPFNQRGDGVLCHLDGRRVLISRILRPPGKTISVPGIADTLGWASLVASAMPFSESVTATVMRSPRFSI